MPRSEPDPVLSATIRRLREGKGLTREALARRAGLMFGTLAQIELAHSAPSWTNFRRIAGALDLSITRLAGAIQAAERTAFNAS
jgi:transcriptional regulator with XRE-family HTH domain